MDNIENMDFEAIHEKQSDELMELLDSRHMKELQTRLEEEACLPQPHLDKENH